jgi:hypothetical protein
LCLSTCRDAVLDNFHGRPQALGRQTPILKFQRFFSCQDPQSFCCHHAYLLVLVAVMAEFRVTYLWKWVQEHAHHLGKSFRRCCGNRSQPPIYVQGEMQFLHMRRLEMRFLCLGQQRSKTCAVSKITSVSQILILT